MKKQIAVGLYVLVAGSAAQAQMIYRCGTEYSQTPCPGGKVLESSDPRSAAQRAEAVRVAADDRRRASEQARERRALESANKPTVAAGFNGRPPAADPAASPADKGKTKGKKASKSKLPGQNADFVAVEPVPPKKRSRP